MRLALLKPRMFYQDDRKCDEVRAGLIHPSSQVSLWRWSLVVCDDTVPCFIRAVNSFLCHSFSNVNSLQILTLTLLAKFATIAPLNKHGGHHNFDSKAQNLIFSKRTQDMTTSQNCPIKLSRILFKIVFSHWCNVYLMLQDKSRSKTFLFYIFFELVKKFVLVMILKKIFIQARRSPC